ncbi:hypothetical protein [Paenibacillus mesophilus]|nr:hypothetical protein [Paenibacillus mesophilus]
MNKPAKKHVVRITKDNPALVRAIVEGLEAANKAKEDMIAFAKSSEKGA